MTHRFSGPMVDAIRATARRIIAASVLSVATSASLAGIEHAAVAQADGERESWSERTLWGDPDLQGEWTSEGEYGVPFERPSEFGTRAFLTHAEYAQRIEDVRRRDANDLAAIDVLAGPVDRPTTPIPHWREYSTTSRRTSLVIDPPDGQIPSRVAGAVPLSAERCGSLRGGEPCDSYSDYDLGVRCIVHEQGFPDTMFPQVYNANLRIVQAPSAVAITYELIHDTRVIRIDTSPQPAAPPLSPAIQMYLGDARGHWEGTTLVVETSNFKGGYRGASPDLRLIERFTRAGQDTIRYEVTFIDPATWSAPWTAALDLKARPDRAGVFEYACHEGNHAMRNMLSASRHLERTANGE